LATAVIALVLIDPELAVSVGFALSVLATGGLILIAPPWSEALQRRGIPPGWAGCPFFFGP
jgi:competence protein ComEC